MKGRFLTSVVEQEQLEVEPVAKFDLPKRYKVLLHNDDYTPMAFVVMVLQRFFFLGETEATTMMLEVHTKGKVCCGVFPRDIAETKVLLINEFARRHEYPLLCSVEQA